jgi:hypothetical protein
VELLYLETLILLKGKQPTSGKFFEPAHLVFRSVKTGNWKDRRNIKI